MLLAGRIAIIGFPIVAILIFFSCSDSQSDRAPIDSDLRLLTYNVWYGFTRVPERKSAWLEWMKAQDADIVFLQELNDYTPAMLETDAASWGHQYSVLLKQDGFPTGITSRYPMEDVQRTIEGFHHGLIRARIRGIYFYNVHLHPSNWQFRIEEVKLILADIRNLPSDANIIIAGDFNTFSPYDSSYYSHHQLEPFFAKRDRENDERNLKEGRLDYTPLQMLNNAGFSDLEYMMRGDRYVFTGSFPTSIEKPGEHGEVRRLDYVFANAGLLDYVHRASIIANDTTQFLSDHLPVIVDLKP